MTINNDIKQFLLNSHKPGIVGFVNEIDKKVYIIYRKSCIEGIISFMEDCKLESYRYKDLQQDYLDNKITINILETYDRISDTDLKLKHTKFINLYTDYKHYGIIRKALSLKVRKFIDADTGLVHIQLVNKANRKFTVGVFTNLERSEKFVSTYYSGNIEEVVYDCGIESIKIRYKEEYE